MTSPSRFSLIGLVLLTLLSGSTVLAQSTDDGSTESRSERRERINNYRRQSSELQEKISDLGEKETERVYIPVLFGVGVNNISPNFGDPRSGGRTHEGEDIMAVKGTPIVSPTKAVVLRTGDGDTEGNYVYTANPGGETFVYMHLDRIGEDVSSGDVLEQGSLIGYVGNTGNASGGAAHLHFEIHDSSRDALDPFPRLTGEFSLSDKISYLTEILEDSSEEEVLAKLLVANFRSTFTTAFNANLQLPPAIIDEMLSTATVAPTTTTAGSSVIGNRNLYMGISGSDVLALQQKLNRLGYTVSLSGPGSVGSETTYFGPATQAAVIKFQVAKGITPTAGYFGPITRAAMSIL